MDTTSTLVVCYRLRNIHVQSTSAVGAHCTSDVVVAWCGNGSGSFLFVVDKPTGHVVVV